MERNRCIYRSPISTAVAALQLEDVKSTPVANISIEKSTWPTQSVSRGSAVFYWRRTRTKTSEGSGTCAWPRLAGWPAVNPLLWRRCLVGTGKSGAARGGGPLHYAQYAITAAHLKPETPSASVRCVSRAEREHGVHTYAYGLFLFQIWGSAALLPPQPQRRGSVRT